MADAHSLRLAASLWSVDPGVQRTALEDAIAGGIDAMHWDVADGALGPAGGFTPARALALTDGVEVRSEAHLMVSDPTGRVDEWTEICERVVVHIESMRWRDALERIESRGCTPALAVGPGTALESVPHDVVDILVMSVAPGTAGSGFRPDAPARARGIASAAQRHSIGWDGSVDLQHASLASSAEVNWLISGGGLFGHTQGPSGWVREARDAWAEPT